jgi:hypothetical protein
MRTFVFVCALFGLVFTLMAASAAEQKPVKPPKPTVKGPRLSIYSERSVGWGEKKCVPPDERRAEERSEEARHEDQPSGADDQAGGSDEDHFQITVLPAVTPVAPKPIIAPTIIAPTKSSAKRTDRPVAKATGKPPAKTVAKQTDRSKAVKAAR